MSSEGRSSARTGSRSAISPSTRETCEVTSGSVVVTSIPATAGVTQAATTSPSARTRQARHSTGGAHPVVVAQGRYVCARGPGGVEDVRALGHLDRVAVDGQLHGGTFIRLRAAAGSRRPKAHRLA